MAAGMLGLTPLTGVVTPFLSYGGSAMVANFAALGMLDGDQRSARRPRATPHRFAAPVRYLAASLAAAAVVADRGHDAGRGLRADDVAIRPHLEPAGRRRAALSIQPARARRGRAIPRGTVYDRSGLPLATGDADAVRTARPAFAKRGIAGRRHMRPQPVERCYPLGGAAFHLLGDATTRVELERVEHVICRARRRGPAARVRRSRDDRAARPMQTGRRTPPSGATIASWCRCCAIATTDSDPAVRRSRAAARRAADDRRAPAMRRSTSLLATTPRSPRSARPPRSCSIPTPASCWRVASYPCPTVTGLDG